jgi:hypothetical protein
MDQYYQERRDSRRSNRRGRKDWKKWWPSLSSLETSSLNSSHFSYFWLEYHIHINHKYTMESYEYPHEQLSTAITDLVKRNIGYISSHYPCAVLYWNYPKNDTGWYQLIQLTHMFAAHVHMIQKNWLKNWNKITYNVKSIGPWTEILNHCLDMTIITINNIWKC